MFQIVHIFSYFDEILSDRTHKHTNRPWYFMWDTDTMRGRETTSLNDVIWLLERIWFVFTYTETLPQTATVTRRLFFFHFTSFWQWGTTKSNNMPHSTTFLLLLSTKINTAVIYLLMAAINKSVIFLRFAVGWFISENREKEKERKKL